MKQANNNIRKHMKYWNNQWMNLTQLIYKTLHPTAKQPFSTYTCETYLMAYIKGHKVSLKTLQRI